MMLVLMILFSSTISGINQIYQEISKNNKFYSILILYFINNYMKKYKGN